MSVNLVSTERECAMFCAESESEPRLFTSTYTHALSVGEHHDVPFLLYYPGGVDTDTENIPLILFLHGQSARGDDITKGKKF